MPCANAPGPLRSLSATAAETSRPAKGWACPTPGAGFPATERGFVFCDESPRSSLRGERSFVAKGGDARCAAYVCRKTLHPTASCGGSWYRGRSFRGRKTSARRGASPTAAAWASTSCPSGQHRTGHPHSNPRSVSSLRGSFVSRDADPRRCDAGSPPAQSNRPGRCPGIRRGSFPRPPGCARSGTRRDTDGIGRV